MKKIFVTGASGTLGKSIIGRLSADSFKVWGLTRNPNADLPESVTTYMGDLSPETNLAWAVADSDVVIHCASNPKDHLATDLGGSRNLLHVLRESKPRHLIYVSIAGVDRSSYPYYRSKFEVEKMVQSSNVPWSIVRATQFHDLVLERIIKPCDKGNGNPLIVPSQMRFQSIDSGDVADAIVDLAQSRPLQSVITIAGPEVLTIEEMARQYLVTQKRSDQIYPQDTRNDFHDVFRSGVNICADTRVGKRKWREFLTATYGASM